MSLFPQNSFPEASIPLEVIRVLEKLLVDPYIWGDWNPVRLSAYFGPLPSWSGVNFSPPICVHAISFKGDPFNMVTKDILHFLSRKADRQDTFDILEDDEEGQAVDAIERGIIFRDGSYTHDWWRYRVSKVTGLEADMSLLYRRRYILDKVKRPHIDEMDKESGRFSLN